MSGASATDSAVALAARVRRGEASAAEAVAKALGRIAARDPELRAMTRVETHRAVAAACAMDHAVASGAQAGPLAGVPFVAKALFDVVHETTSAGAAMRLEAPPAPADAMAVRRLRDAGAILLGATNMDAFAYGFTTQNADFGTTRNPRDPGCLAGGSSGGSAAAVAAGMAHLALGTDTNGSIRVPAAFCGVWGIKPTFGRLSRAGAFPFVASLDHVGLFARGVADLSAGYDALQGADPRDPAQSDRASEPTFQTLTQEIGGLRVGSLGGWFRHGAAPEALAAVDAAAASLDARPDVDLPQSDLARAAAFAITASESASLHLPNLRARPEAFDPMIRDRLLAGALLPAAMVAQAQRFRSRFRERAARLLERFDVLLAPATPFAAISDADGGPPPAVRASIGAYTQPISFIGLPVVTAPVFLGRALPCGVQIIAAPWREDLALRVAAYLEAEGIAACPVAP